MALTVSQLARLAGVSVRTLHHYDEISLLRPSARSDAGYRLYDQKDLQRLQQVLFFRELGFPLEEIARIMRDPSFEVRAALLMHRQLLTEKSVRIKALLGAVDATLEAMEKGRTMSKEEMFEVFGDYDPTKHEIEAKERWGNSEAYRESKKRTANYGKEQWRTIKAEGERIHLALADLLQTGKPPTDAAAMKIAEKHRQYIEHWFYPCTRQMHAGVAELYVSDSRFTENIDRLRPGLAQYMRDAIRANSGRAD
jgi:DNA-binding transcriptional MerR regulator